MDTLPINYATGQPYQGGNILALLAAAADAGYPTDQWAGYHQLADLGLQVRRGEHGTRITVVYPDPKDPERTRVTTRTVFNVAQCAEMTDAERAAYQDRKERKAAESAAGKGKRHKRAA